MTFGKWNTSGELTWIPGNNVTASDLNTSIDETMPPIGAVIAWMKSFTGVPATLPDGWVECNGQVLSDADSPLNGQTIPDLNVTARFLRGAATSGGTGGADTHNHQWYVNSSGNSYNASGTANVDISSQLEQDNTTSQFVDYFFSSADTYTGNTSTLPAYMNVVWIMRIK